MLCVSVLLLLIIFLCISAPSPLCVQRFFSKIALVKNLLPTQFKQANFKIRRHISNRKFKRTF